MMFLFYIAYYAAFTIPLYLVAGRLGRQDSWWAFVPILNLVLLCWCADQSGWMALAFVVPLVNLIVLGYLWSIVATKLGQQAVLGWLCAIPLAGVVLQWIIAMTGREGTAPSSA